MATNLRLRPETEHALKLEAERSGRSQQEIIREALDLHLGLRTLGGRARGIEDLSTAYRTEAPPRDESGGSSMDELRALTADSTLLPPQTPFRAAVKRLRLPAGVTTSDLMNRDDRI